MNTTQDTASSRLAWLAFLRMALLATAFILVGTAGAQPTPLDAGLPSSLTVSPVIENVGGKKVEAIDQAPDSKYGQFLAIDGDHVVAGAVEKNNFTGTAYVYTRNQGGISNYGQLYQLTAPDAAERDQFGYSVAIKNDVIAVGAPGKSRNAGKVYLFSVLTGELIASLQAPDAVTRDRFGFSVALDGDLVLVSAPYKNVDAPNPPGITNLRGKVYAFARHVGGTNAYGLIAEILEPNASDRNEFGFAVALSGSTAVISSNDYQSRRGAAYIYDITMGAGAALLKMLQPAGLVPDAQFGRSVSIDGDSVAIGASGQAVGANEKQGRIYFYSRNLGGTNAFGLGAEITAMDGAANDYLGRGISIRTKEAAIGTTVSPIVVVTAGAPGKNNSTGAVYSFDISVGVALPLDPIMSAAIAVGTEKIDATGLPNDQLGFSVALNSANTIVSGAVGVNNGAGAIYIFKTGLVCNIMGAISPSLGCSLDSDPAL